MFFRVSAFCPLLDGEVSWMGQEVTGRKEKEQSCKMGQGQRAGAACGKAVGRAGALLWGKQCVQTSLSFTKCWSISHEVCKLGWLSQSLRGQKVLIQQSRWAVTAPAKAGREKSTGKKGSGGSWCSKHGGNVSLLQSYTKWYKLCCYFVSIQEEENTVQCLPSFAKDGNQM